MDLTERQRRAGVCGENALELAIRAGQPSEPYQKTIERARAFKAFLLEPSDEAAGSQTGDSSLRSAT